MGLSSRIKRCGYWKTQSTNCYKDHEANDDLNLVICRGRVYFDSQFAYCLHTHQTHLVRGPEVTEDTLVITNN